MKKVLTVCEEFVIIIVVNELPTIKKKKVEKYEDIISRTCWSLFNI